MADPTTYASKRQYVGLAVQTSQDTPVVPAVTMPVEKFDPFDQPTWLDDKSLRGSMTEPYNRVQGVEHSEGDGAGPAYFDTFPYLLSNIFGDNVYSGTYTGSGTTTLSGASIAGATSISTVASIAGSTLIQIDTGVNSEVRLTTGVSGVGPFTVTFATALLVGHAGGATVKPITSPYSSAFAVLNSGSAQPKSLSISDYQGPPASTGIRVYSGACLSELSIKGTPESSTVDWAGKFQGWPSSIPVTFASSPSAVTPQASWEMQVGLNGTIGGSQIKTINDFSLTISRELELIYTAQNLQVPYFIQRGVLTVGGMLNFVAANESPITYLMSNTQPQMQILVSNGLSGANLLSLQIDILKAAFSDTKIQRGKAAVEYQTNFIAVANTTNVGWSGGFGPAVLTVQNAITPNSY